MQAIYRGRGESIDYTPSSDVAVGAVVVQGDLVGVASRPISANALGALVIEGLVDVVKAAEALTVGTPVYWDADGDPVGGTAGSGAATATATANTLIGVVVAAAADTAATVQVKLMPGSNVWHP